MPQTLNRTTIEEILRSWCWANHCEWGHAYLLNRKAWDARRHANPNGEVSLPAADWVLSLVNSGLFDALNRTYPDRLWLESLMAHLRLHGLMIELLTPCYARVCELPSKSPG
jgi:hypothetical protein